MKVRWFMCAALALAGTLVFTSAFTQDAPKPQPKSSAKAMLDKPARKAKVDPKDGKQISPYSLAERTAMAKIDCAPGTGTHGVYRGYTQWDPQLKTTAGKELFAACVKRGLEPAPWFAVHRVAYGMGAKTAFGKSKEDCLKCHEKGY
jgi:hypothetical protein